MSSVRHFELVQSLLYYTDNGVGRVTQFDVGFHGYQLYLALEKFPKEAGITISVNQEIASER